MIDPEDFITILKDLLFLDPTAANNLIESRVPCNSSVEDHKTLVPYINEGELQIGPLGLLNGILGKYGYRVIAHYHDNPTIKLFDFTLQKLQNIEDCEMEKKAVIEESITPPELKEEKQASQKDLEDHITKRLADTICKCEKLCSKKE